jgi:hypothetical protein
MSTRKRVTYTSTSRSSARKVPRLTYATLAVTPDDDRAYEQAVAQVRGELGRHFANYVDGIARGASQEFAHASPINTDWIVSYFPQGTREDARDAIQAARRRILIR